jgi:hypothetical protein
MTDIGDPSAWGEQLTIACKWSTWTIDSADPKGIVDITCDDDNNHHHCLFLSQDELKEVIAFLQRQIK